MSTAPPCGLDAAVRALPLPVFAVCDGAAYPDLPAALRAAGLWPRSLFLEVPQRQAARSGPWLVPLSVDRWRDDVAEVLAVLGPRARAVFWAWPECGDGEWPGEAAVDSLYRHLRGLNSVHIPRAPPPGEEPAMTALFGPHEPVLFRHWCPVALAHTLPALDGAQRARLFGPALALLLPAPDAPGGALVAKRRADWPEPARGFLRLGASQMDAISAAMLTRSRARIADYLRDAAPARAAALGDDALARLVDEAGESGWALGVVSERAHGLWAYLALITDGRVLSDPGVLGFVRDGAGEAGWADDTPDGRVSGLVLGLAEGAGDGGGAKASPP